jgi:alpha-methylacyl-CoA racemase
MGPLHGLKVIELAGIGPGPMAAMLLADMGATVLRIDRQVGPGLGVDRPQRFDLLLRNRRSVALDLKQAGAAALVLEMVRRADVLIEGFRPGVAERLALGPDVCLERNPRLVYGRMTGWGQNGPLAQVVGHDINFIALAGVLSAIGREGQPPAVPLNLVGDFGGGTLYLVIGILAALQERAVSGKGQVVDAAMIDGISSLMTQPYGTHAAGMMSNERGTNITDSGAPFYDAYECADGGWIALGAVETKFYEKALEVLGLPDLLADQWKRDQWPAGKRRIAARVKEKTREEWTAAFEGTESCFAPMLSLEEVPLHPHVRARRTIVEVDGVKQPAPAPRFSRTPSQEPVAFRPWSLAEAHEILGPWLAGGDIDRAVADGVLS